MDVMLKERGGLLVVDGEAGYIASQAPALEQPNNGAVAASVTAGGTGLVICHPKPKMASVTIRGWGMYQKAHPAGFPC